MKQINCFIVAMLITLCFERNLFAQGIVNNWLLGDGSILPPFVTNMHARINFSNTIDSIKTDTRKMNFLATQGNISDKNGNLLMSSNGIWIADATGDTMLNGADLNPGGWANAYHSSGLNQIHTNLFLPFPDDTMKYILFHSTGYYQFVSGVQLFYSVIDISLNNGLGAVISKNNLIPIQHLGVGFTACKHANGRDWWIALPSDSFNVINKILLTPTGISILPAQSFTSNYPSEFSIIHPAFSPDGNHFAFTTCPGQAWGPLSRHLRFFDFDRCNGNFTYVRGFPIQDTVYAYPVAFSANSKFLYFSSYHKLFQLNVDSIYSFYPVTHIATWNGFVDSANFQTPQFATMYLASNNKIYISDFSESIYVSRIEFPDSLGLSANLQQHVLISSCLLSGSIPNHPNYFLGKMENSICDTLLSIKKSEFRVQSEKITVFPNPAREQFTVYQRQAHENYFVLIDAMGRDVIRKKISGKECIINTDALQQGIYFWSCANQRGKINVLK